MFELTDRLLCATNTLALGTLQDKSTHETPREAPGKIQEKPRTSQGKVKERSRKAQNSSNRSASGRWEAPALDARGLIEGIRLT